MRRRKRYWTTSEIDFIRQNYLFMTAKEMGYFLNRTPELVQWKKQKLNLKKIRNFSNEEKERIIKLFEEGYSYNQIALKLHASFNSIHFQLKLMRQKGRIIKRKINSNFNDKYTFEEEQLIKELYPANETVLLCKLLKRSYEAIKQKANKMGVVKDEKYLKKKKHEIYKNWQKSWW